MNNLLDHVCSVHLWFHRSVCFLLWSIYIRQLSPWPDLFRKRLMTKSIQARRVDNFCLLPEPSSSVYDDELTGCDWHIGAEDLDHKDKYVSIDCCSSRLSWTQDMLLIDLVTYRWKCVTMRPSDMIKITKSIAFIWNNVFAKCILIVMTTNSF